MPNWCAGDLRVRGTKENLIKFLLDGLNPIKNICNELEPLKINENGEICGDTCHIKGTHRGFVKGLDIYVDDLENEGKSTIVLSVEFAWSIKPQDLLNVCREYGVDMKIHAFERGMQFNQIIEIIDSEITKEAEIRFKDYEWDCICPNVGG